MPKFVEQSQNYPKNKEKLVPKKTDILENMLKKVCVRGQKDGNKKIKEHFRFWEYDLLEKSISWKFSF